MPQRAIPPVTPPSARRTNRSLQTPASPRPAGTTNAAGDDAQVPIPLVSPPSVQKINRSLQTPASPVLRAPLMPPRRCLRRRHRLRGHPLRYRRSGHCECPWPVRRVPKMKRVTQPMDQISCEVVICDADEKVEDNVCVPCGVDFTPSSG